MGGQTAVTANTPGVATATQVAPGAAQVQVATMPAPNVATMPAQQAQQQEQTPSAPKPLNTPTNADISAMMKNPALAKYITAPQLLATHLNTEANRVAAHEAAARAAAAANSTKGGYSLSSKQ